MFLSREQLADDPDVEDEKHVMFNSTRKFSATQLRLGKLASKKYA
jgi:hypothetical protein